MTDLIKLVSKTEGHKKPDQYLVEQLEHLTGMAKSGELRGLIYAGAVLDGRITWGWQGNGSDVVMSGALTHVTAIWHKSITDADEKHQVE